MGMDGYGYGIGLDLCVGLFYEHRFAVLIIGNDGDCEDNDIITKLPNMSTLELTRRKPSILINLVKTRDFQKLFGKGISVTQVATMTMLVLEREDFNHLWLHNKWMHRCPGVALLYFDQFGQNQRLTQVQQ